MFYKSSPAYIGYYIWGIIQHKKDHLGEMISCTYTDKPANINAPGLYLSYTLSLVCRKRVMHMEILMCFSLLQTLSSVVVHMFTCRGRFGAIKL